MKNETFFAAPKRTWKSAPSPGWGASSPVGNCLQELLFKNTEQLKGIIASQSYMQEEIRLGFESTRKYFLLKPLSPAKGRCVTGRLCCNLCAEEREGAT